ncbi:MAG: DegT/DnrJ/EryC1/StrS family aminotransferase [Paracoccaceae bacterium]
MIKMLPFLNLSQTYKALEVEIDVAIKNVLLSGEYVLGEETSNFENEWAKFCHAKHAVGLGNGLDALTLSLKALGIGEDDEVIVPANTYIATWLAVSNCGATPIPVEPEQKSMNIDYKKIEGEITENTKAIIPVHLYGQPADLSEINKIAKKHGLWIVEDAAQCHGASYHKRPIGSHSDVVAWSFYPSKNLGCFGDGGAITTNSTALSKRIQQLRNYGSTKKYRNEIIGFNSRLDPIQAAILRVKLKHLKKWNEQRSVIAQLYLSKLQTLPLTLPSVLPKRTSVWHQFVIRTPLRDELQNALTKAGIQTLIHYPVPPFSQKAYDNFKKTFTSSITS